MRVTFFQSDKPQQISPPEVQHLDYFNIDPDSILIDSSNLSDESKMAASQTAIPPNYNRQIRWVYLRNEHWKAKNYYRFFFIAQKTGLIERNSFETKCSVEYNCRIVRAILYSESTQYGFLWRYYEYFYTKPNVFPCTRWRRRARAFFALFKEHTQRKFQWSYFSNSFTHSELISKETYASNKRRNREFNICMAMLITKSIINGHCVFMLYGSESRAEQVLIKKRKVSVKYACNWCTPREKEKSFP